MSYWDKPFVVPFTTVNGYYIFDVNTNSILTVNEVVYQEICDILATDESKTHNLSKPSNDLLRLQQCGYLSSKHVKRIEHPSSSQLKAMYTRGIEKITLQLTQQCNFRCKYCIYTEKDHKMQRNHSNRQMSWDIAKKAIDYLYDHSVYIRFPVNICLYGGEKLLAFELIKRVVSYAKTRF